MASLACQRAGGTCIGSGLGRICHEPLDAGSSAVAAILKPSECPSPRLWSYCPANDRNGAFLGTVSGSAGVEGRRFTIGAHEGGPSVCVFPETAQMLQRSEGVLRNHHTSSVAQWPEAMNKATEAVGQTSLFQVHQPAMAYDTASTASPSVSSSSDEEELSSDQSFEALFDSSASSPQRDEGPLDCLSSLNEALPAKRGLSNYFTGKSQSFSCLADVRSVADLAKPLNPFVKRRKTSSCLGKEAGYTPKSLPPPSISKRVNSHRKASHGVVVVAPRAVSQEMIYSVATDSPRNSISLKCFSSPELGEADL